MPTDLENYRAGLDNDKWERHLETTMGYVGLNPVNQYPWPAEEKKVGRYFPTTPTGKVRGYTADFAFVPERLLVEIDGKVWQKGGHTSGTGYTEDRERDAEALCCNWRTLRVTSGQVESGLALAWIERLVKGDK